MCVLLLSASSLAQDGSDQKLILSQKNGTKKKEIKIGEKLTVLASGDKLKGRITGIALDSIEVDDKAIPLATISLIKRNKEGKTLGFFLIPIGFLYSLERSNSVADTGLGAYIAVGSIMSASGIFLTLKSKHSSDKWSYSIE